MISILISLLVLLIVLYVVKLVIDQLTLPPPVKTIVFLIVGLIFLVWLLQIIGFPVMRGIW